MERERGSIPACAGEPTARRYGDYMPTVYPRVCGGTGDISPVFPHNPGLSPRVRGNLELPRVGPANQRSIPACAGEPPGKPFTGYARRVYPRVCGGTSRIFSDQDSLSGLSPRVRGNPGHGRIRHTARRSIPACAGEPRSIIGIEDVEGVYPRVCGGTALNTLPSLPSWGLSPRVRGNPRRPGCTAPDTRSIPACAGEPATSWRPYWRL